MSRLLEVSEEVRSDARVIALNGELDLDSADQAREPLERAAGDPEVRLVIDLSRCEFIDSTGLATIVHATRPLRDNGHTVRLVCPRGDVRKLLELSALNLSFPIHDHLDDALENNSGSAA